MAVLSYYSVLTLVLLNWMENMFRPYPDWSNVARVCKSGLLQRVHTGDGQLPLEWYPRKNMQKLNRQTRSQMLRFCISFFTFTGQMTGFKMFFCLKTSNVDLFYWCIFKLLSLLQKDKNKGADCPPRLPYKIQNLLVIVRNDKHYRYNTQSK